MNTNHLSNINDTLTPNLDNQSSNSHICLTCKKNLPLKDGKLSISNEHQISKDSNRSQPNNTNGTSTPSRVTSNQNIPSDLSNTSNIQLNEDVIHSTNSKCECRQNLNLKENNENCVTQPNTANKSDTSSDLNEEHSRNAEDQVGECPEFDLGDNIDDQLNKSNEISKKHRNKSKKKHDVSEDSFLSKKREKNTRSLIKRIQISAFRPLEINQEVCQPSVIYAPERITALTTSENLIGDLLMGTSTGTLEVYKEGHHQSSFNCHEKEVTCILDLSNNKQEFVTSGKDRTLKVWRIGMGTSIKPIKQKHNSLQLALTSNPAHILSLEDDLVIRNWDIEKGRVYDTIEEGKIIAFENLQIKTDYDYILVSDHYFGVSLWSLQDCQKIRTIWQNDGSSEKIQGEVNKLIFYENSSFFCCTSNSIFLLDFNEENCMPEIIVSLTDEKSILDTILLSPQILVYLTSNGEMIFLDITYENFEILNVIDLGFIPTTAKDLKVYFSETDNMLYLYGHE